MVTGGRVAGNRHVLHEVPVCVRVGVDEVLGRGLNTEVLGAVRREALAVSRDGLTGAGVGSVHAHLALPGRILLVLPARGTARFCLGDGGGKGRDSQSHAKQSHDE